MIIKGEDIPYMGEWADLKKNYLIEEKPEDYDELEEGKMLIEYLIAIQDKYSKRFDELVEHQMEIERDKPKKYKSFVKDSKVNEPRNILNID